MFQHTLTDVILLKASRNFISHTLDIGNAAHSFQKLSNTFWTEGVSLWLPETIKHILNRGSKLMAFRNYQTHSQQRDLAHGFQKLSNTCWTEGSSSRLPETIKHTLNIRNPAHSFQKLSNSHLTEGIPHTANEGPVRIQYKCLVSINVFPERKLLFPKQNYNVLSPSIYTHISVRDLHISKNGLPILLQGNMWTDHRNI